MGMKIRLTTRPAKVASESTLRDHLQTSFDSLPNKLPPHNQGRLLDDLCFLLCCSLFLYTIRPRLQHVHPTTNDVLAFTNNMKTQSYLIVVPKLNIKIDWVAGSWTTQLRYGNMVLLEGRQLFVPKEAGFEQSFRWFCEEAECLWYEFKARELAAAVLTGSVVESDTGSSGDDTMNECRNNRAGFSDPKQRRITKLKVRLSYTNGRPVPAP